MAKGRMSNASSFFHWWRIARTLGAYPGDCLLWRECCDISAGGTISFYLQLGCGLRSSFGRTLYSAKASFHELTNAESSQISSCAISSASPSILLRL